MTDEPEPSSPTGLDLGALLEQAQAMQEQMAAAQGMVTVEMTGAGQFRSVSISPDVVDPEDVELLEDLVLAALRDAAAQVMELQQDTLGGLDLGGLGGLLGE